MTAMVQIASHGDGATLLGGAPLGGALLGGALLEGAVLEASGFGAVALREASVGTMSSRGLVRSLPVGMRAGVHRGPIARFACFSYERQQGPRLCAGNLLDLEVGIP